MLEGNCKTKTTKEGINNWIMKALNRSPSTKFSVGFLSHSSKKDEQDWQDYEPADSLRVMLRVKAFFMYIINK